MTDTNEFSQLRLPVYKKSRHTWVQCTWSTGFKVIFDFFISLYRIPGI